MVELSCYFVGSLLDSGCIMRGRLRNLFVDQYSYQQSWAPDFGSAESQLVGPVTNRLVDLKRLEQVQKSEMDVVVVVVAVAYCSPTSGLDSSRMTDRDAPLGFAEVVAVFVASCSGDIAVGVVAGIADADAVAVVVELGAADLVDGSRLDSYLRADLCCSASKCPLECPCRPSRLWPSQIES